MNSLGEGGGVLRRYGREFRNEFGLVVATFLVLAATTYVNRSYIEKPADNAIEILRQTALLGTFALGAGIVIISGGIDLSSGSVIAFSGSVCGLTMAALAPVDPDTGLRSMEALGAGWLVVAIGGAVATGLAIGTLHAWLITSIGLPPFVATLASLVGLRSLARIMNQAVTDSLGQRVTKITLDNELLLELDRLWWIPVVVFLALSVLTWFLMNRTVVGRHLYAMGGNEEAARLSGIRTDRLKWLAYVIGATTAAIAGVLYAARAGAVDPVTMGLGYELNAIAAAVVGGCSLTGGLGFIPGIMLGVLFLRVVIYSVSKVIKGSSDQYEGLIVGVLIVLAVAFNELRGRTGGARKAFFSGWLGGVTIPLLAILVGLVSQILVVGDFHTSLAGAWAAATTLAVLTALKLVERRRGR
jgi:ribose/xylose/arabinose/galactoside ABC-type transport system permease subunit